MSMPSARAPEPRRGSRPSLFAHCMVLVACGIGSMLLSACGSADAVRSDDAPVPVQPNDAPVVEEAVRAPAPTAVPPPPAPAVAQLIHDALRSDGSISRPALLRRLGPPQHVTIEPIQNQYGTGATDTIRTLTYSGLRAMIYEATQSTRNFLIRLVLVDGRYASPEGLRVGMRPPQVIAAIGPPTEWDDVTGELIYAERESMPTALILTVKNGRVTQIAWEFYFS